MNRDFIEAIEALEKERNIKKEVLFEAIEDALVSAYKKNYGTSDNVRVDINKETGDINVYMRMDVVEEIEDELTQLSLEEAREIDYRYQVGDVIEYQVTPKDFGRLAAQTAKQVVIQRIREAEREMIYDEYIIQVGDVITGTIERISPDFIHVNLGKTEGILYAIEQIESENYKVNDRIKVYILDVRKSAKGPQIFLSRTHPGLVQKLFEMEVPEIAEGLVEIVSMAREPGSRTKICVRGTSPEIDPIGATIGTRGMRVQNIVDELGGEKIDVIPWAEDPEQLIANSLSPSKVDKVFILSEEEKTSRAIVPDYHLSLAIGKDGQNARLAVRVSGWKIDIRSRGQYAKMLPELESPERELAEEFLMSRDDLFRKKGKYLEEKYGLTPNLDVDEAEQYGQEEVEEPLDNVEGIHFIED